MLARDQELGPLMISETHIEMKLAPLITADDVVPTATKCAEHQGGPPQKSSLLYQPGKMLLYLPKQCLLDEKVAAS